MLRKYWNYNHFDTTSRIARACRVLSWLSFWLLIAGIVNAQETQPKYPQSLPVQGIENVWQLGPELFSGGDPGSPDGLAKLKALGIRSIVSVDGTRPDVENARKLGLRYAHIPFGYDGVPADTQLLLAKSVANLPRPIYIHCHHGKHRGPAGASIMARYGLNWSVDEAVGFMKMAGTSADYPGLYASVKSFQVPTNKELDELKQPLPESVEVPDMVEMMVQIDTRFDRLKDWLNQSTTNPAKKAVIAPDQEAIQLRELVREAARLPECQARPEVFRKSFVDLDHDLTKWISLVQKDQSPKTDHLSDLNVVLKQASGRCNACHKAFRN